MDHNLRGDICSEALACLGVSSKAELVGVLLRISAPLPISSSLGATVGDPLFNRRSRPANQRT